MLSNSDIKELTEFRRFLHQYPEISGGEFETAKIIVKALEKLNPTKILTNLGGAGVAAIFDTGKKGPTVLFRAELDALPIEEISDNDWKSKIAGKGHLCGHDGHMTMLLALGRLISRKPVATGRVILMFQPAEEDGSGARAVVAEIAYEEIKPDWAFAIHNEPGRPLAYVSIRAGLMNCASQGLQIKLTGKTAHAADPQDGVSPMLGVAKLLPQLDALGDGRELDESFKLSTLTHVQIGEPTFGIAPADAVINVTLRATTDENLAQMVVAARNLAKQVASENQLNVEFEDCDKFAATVNDLEATKIACDAMNSLGIKNGDFGLPMRASEDFGVFGWEAKAAMICLGSGETHVALHNPDFDFPDDLIPIGASIFERIARDLLGSVSIS